MSKGCKYEKEYIIYQMERIRKFSQDREGSKSSSASHRVVPEL